MEPERYHSGRPVDQSRPEVRKIDAALDRVGEVAIRTP